METESCSAEGGVGKTAQCFGKDTSYGIVKWFVIAGLNGFKLLSADRACV